MLREIENLILVFFIYSFAGWFMESVGGILKEKRFINRGFLIGPYCPVYGYGVVAITLLLGKYKDDFVTLFIMSTLLCGSLEYLTSYIMEKLFHARWWDYHNHKFNINGRICLETMLPFGIAGSVILCILNPMIYSKLALLPDLVMNIISALLVIIFIADNIISFIIINSFKEEIYKKQDNTEEISNKVKEKTEKINKKIKDKAEDTIMQLESTAIEAGRDIKYRKLKLQRKVKYTRRMILNKASKISVRKLATKIKEKGTGVKLSIKKKTKEIDIQIKAKQKELSNQIIESFKKKSALSRRLIEAFPKLTIKFGREKDDKLQK